MPVTPLPPLPALGLDLRAAVPQCVRDPSTWCAQVYTLTGSDWLAGTAEWLVARPAKILLILLIAVIVRWLGRRTIDRMTRGHVPKLLRPLRERASGLGATVVGERRRQRTQTIGSVLKSMLSVVVFGLAAVLILGQLGVELAPIIASAGVIGVAVGFGAQNLVKDFISGMFMMLEDQYGVGDVIDVGEATGTVETVGLRVTTLRDIHGTVWYVRNGEVRRVGNFSQGYAVAVVDVLIGYDADVDVALDIVRGVLADTGTTEAMSADALAEPELLGIESVTPEAVTVRSTVKVRPGRQWAVQRGLRARLVDALNDADIPPPLGRVGGSAAAAPATPASRPRDAAADGQDGSGLGS